MRHRMRRNGSPGSAYSGHLLPISRQRQPQDWERNRVELVQLLCGVARNYDRSAGFDSEAQQLLKAARDVITPLLPVGYLVEGSGGKGNPAVVPWIGVFDPDETTTAQRGMYVVYLFAADMSSIVLSLAQG